MINYPEGFGRCLGCGADRNAPCTIISGGIDGNYQPTDAPELQTGARRDGPHPGRRQIGDDREPPLTFVALKDEPNHYADQPHTPQCGPVCPVVTRLPS